MNTKKLFAVILGGRAPGCHIELHDIVFVTGDSLEEAQPRLVNKWFGQKKRLHIDSSIELDIVDGYKISLSNDLPTSEEQKLLHCVNFGGYRENFLGELHEIKFYVGSNKKDIVKRAKTELCVGTIQQHCDDNLIVGEQTEQDVDDVFTVGCVDGYYLHLTPTTETSTQQVASSYRRLDVPRILEQADAISNEMLTAV